MEPDAPAAWRHPERPAVARAQDPLERVAGLRIGEATALRWRDTDLANGNSKTDAGIRLVDILPALRDEITSHRHAAAGAQPDDLVFPTSMGTGAASEPLQTEAYQGAGDDEVPGNP